MPHQHQVHTAVSAPGKVLLTGGYLVLDRAYTGTVLALDARIHVIVQQLSRSNSPTGGKPDAETGTAEGDQAEQKEGEADEDCRIVVRSPQFIDAVWEYGIERVDQGGGVKVAQIGDTPRNPFVETALNYSLTYINYVAASKHFGSLSITILADNDYYSETETSKGPAAASRGHFASFGVTLRDAHKTGLGSSAALVTALVSAVVIHRTMHADDLDVARAKLHNLAQAAHCAAQGKVGSGFDVAAAVYGTCLYRRFSPSVLSKLGDVGSPQFEERLFTTVEDLDPEHPWDAQSIDFGTRLPRGMQMVLCDVDCGSQTPSMVKKVLAWREDNREEADSLWSELQCNNEKLRQELKRLAQPPVAEQDYSQVREIISTSRGYIRSMTEKSGVPIEPIVQKELLDALLEVDGVVGGLVPGAGGYDAIAVLIRDDLETVETLRKFLEGWKSTKEDDFGGKIERVRLLGVRHGSEGVRNENPRQYAGWVQ
ncbi:phosphomevalonate kinase [Arachnomyces sp. PD_36]|nr:phosphomevalonate kinase [Arachnomyces sp. PD_36]